MRTNLIKQVRALLRENPDGLTGSEIAARTGRSYDSVRRALERMPDAYRDRWEGPVRGQFLAVWCVVVPPPDCPRPVRSVQ